MVAAWVGDAVTGLYVKQADGSWRDRDKVWPPPVAPSPILVPETGVLFGAVANAFSNRPGWPAQGPDAHREFEDQIGRKVGVYAAYYKGGGTLFPKASEIALAHESGMERVLYMHWRINDWDRTAKTGTTWAQVVAGDFDAIIDAECTYLLANFPDDKFFLSLSSEMEPYVWTTGSGMEPSDFVAMYQYVRDRFEANGVTNVVWVLAYMGYPRWASESWFDDLYPGDDYVDWIAWDPYSNTGGTYMDFAGLMNNIYDRVDAGFTGFYKDKVPLHPDKPYMLSEWGVFHTTGTLTKKADFYDSVVAQLDSFPAIKAMVKFDTDNDLYGGGGDISCFSDAGNLAAFIDMAADPRFVNLEIG